MSTRTDLISEQREQNNKKIKGIETFDEQIGTASISTVKVLESEAEEILGKPKGTYCTVEFERLDRICDTDDLIKATVRALEILIPKNWGSALVVGLGNTDITPDALGPFTADGVLATRHLSGSLKRTLGLENLKEVSCMVPGVLGKTGIETYDIIACTAKRVNPSVIIAIDALAARSPHRLCRTVQLSDSGICPGAGVNNCRRELSFKTVGVPVIAVGIPTVIDADGLFKKENMKENMMVTPKEIDLLVEKSAAFLSRALNIYLQPSLDISVIESLT